MKKRMSTKIFSYVMALSLALSMLVGATGAETAQAAKKGVKLSAKKVNVNRGKSKKVRIKGSLKNLSKIKWKIKNKKIASVKKSGKYAVKVKGKKVGRTVLTCRAKYKKKKITLKCNVKVKKAKKTDKDGKGQQGTSSPEPGSGAGSSPSAAPTNTPSASPTGTPNQSPTGTPSQSPTSKPSQSPTSKPSQSPTGTPDTAGFEPVVYKTASFENGVDGFTSRGGAEKLDSVSGGYSGKALSVTGRGANWHGASLNVSKDIAKGATYTFSAWVKQDSGAAKAVKLSVQLSAGGTETYPAVAEVSCESGEWTKIEGTYEVPASFSSLAFYFEGPDGTYDIMVDEVVITQITKGKETIDPMKLASLKDAYSGIFGHIGTCINYNGWQQGKQMQDDSLMDFVQKQYNSISLENEMKPDAVLGTFSGLTLAQAKAKGYIIPENYKENSVPELHLDTVDRVLEIAQKRGLKMRAHTLQWHQQTQGWFFKEGYSANGATLKDTDVMDARLEFYVRNVMKHVMDKEKELTGKAGSIVYCWDVTNEYTHRKNGPQSPSWTDVYGDMGDEPSYVKKAFENAYDMLKQYGVEKDVTLFYNDYNTYYETEDILRLVEFINRGEPAKICGGIGMQSHIDVMRPTLEQYEAALDKFLATGLEVQITELDITINFVENGQDNEDQAQFFYDYMKMLVEKQKNRDKSVSPKGITGVTLWGISDAVSWRSSNAPLLFGTGIDDPKPSFYKVLEAAE